VGDSRALKDKIVQFFAVVFIFIFGFSFFFGCAYFIICCAFYSSSHEKDVKLIFVFGVEIHRSVYVMRVYFLFF